MGFAAFMLSVYIIQILFLVFFGMLAAAKVYEFILKRVNKDIK